MYSIAGKNLMLNALAAAAELASLHSDDPGALGTANELAGGDPAYSRKAVAWNAAADGSLDSSNVPVFDIPAGSTVAYAGFWSAAGVFLGSGAVTTPEVYAGQGTYELTDADLDLNS